MWTRFMDMHSGGRLKESPYQYIYIEASEKEAMIVFYNRFGHNPERVSCTCCGEDYSICESKTITEASGYNRNCKYDEKKKRYIEKQRDDNCGLYKTIKEYVKEKDVLLIRSKNIKKDERIGEIPDEGYIWI